jgi:hypothetical protein
MLKLKFANRIAVNKSTDQHGRATFTKGSSYHHAVPRTHAMTIGKDIQQSNTQNGGNKVRTLTGPTTDIKGYISCNFIDLIMSKQ